MKKLVWALAIVVILFLGLYAYSKTGSESEHVSDADLSEINAQLDEVQDAQEANQQKEDDQEENQ
ncbi:hypothetical protein ACFL07_11590 [Pseudomonadota bacterium]